MTPNKASLCWFNELLRSTCHTRTDEFSSPLTKAPPFLRRSPAPPPSRVKVSWSSPPASGAPTTTAASSPQPTTRPYEAGTSAPWGERRHPRDPLGGLFRWRADFTSFFTALIAESDGISPTAAAELRCHWRLVFFFLYSYLPVSVNALLFSLHLIKRSCRLCKSDRNESCTLNSGLTGFTGCLHVITCRHLNALHRAVCLILLIMLREFCHDCLSVHQETHACLHITASEQVHIISSCCEQIFFWFWWKLCVTVGNEQRHKCD